MIGTVIGEFIDPAFGPLSGKVVITPTTGRVLLTAPLRTVLGGVDLLVDRNGRVWKELTASVNNPAATPQDFTYVAEFELRRGRIPVFAAPVFFTLPDGGTVDLTSVTPAAESAGIPVLRGAGLPDPADGIDGQVVVLVDGVPSWADQPAPAAPPFLTLTLTDPIPAGTPAGTLIIRTQEVAP